jgi:excinuclease ABC subunit C
MIKNGLDGYKELASSNILLTIPIEVGYKLFLVSKGNIIHSGIYNKLTHEIKEQFISEGMLRMNELEFPTNNEKIWIDYRDILYSEISDLSDEMIDIIP